MCVLQVPVPVPVPGPPVPVPVPNPIPTPVSLQCSDSRLHVPGWRVHEVVHASASAVKL
jgi:hypothetical protein